MCQDKELKQIKEIRNGKNYIQRHFTVSIPHLILFSYQTIQQIRHMAHKRKTNAYKILI